MSEIEFKAYLITDRKIVPDGKLVESVEAAVRSGIKAVQLREKDLPVGTLLGYALELRSMTNRYGAKLFINDRVDIALACGADGVHLGGGSIPLKAVRKMFGDDLLIGVSCHDPEEAAAAERGGADFITFGPVFETPSKLKYGGPVGLEALRTIVKDTELPVFALGGINELNIPEVLRTGVKGVSMISAILGASDIEKKTREIVRMAG